jgi:hypothetical protein
MNKEIFLLKNFFIHLLKYSMPIFYFHNREKTPEDVFDPKTCRKPNVQKSGDSSKRQHLPQRLQAEQDVVFTRLSPAIEREILDR